MSPPRPSTDTGETCTDWSQAGWRYFKRVLQADGCGFEAMARQCPAPAHPGAS